MLSQRGKQRVPGPIGRSLANAVPRSFWLDQPGAPEPSPALAGRVTVDLAIVGGGFTGLWTALLARERDPSREVVILEARTSGWAASGRNGGFCSASLTHGLANGLERFPRDLPLLERLGEENLREIGDTVARYAIDCDFSRTGELSVATAPWQPFWDYVLVTEPLSAAQLASLGWRDRRGACDMGNQFHYFRLTADNRILWGGYDAVYYNGGRIRAEHAARPETYTKLASHFFATFPQLEGVSFTHAWGGVIDTCSRFCAFFGTAYRRRLAYTAGYTGLGVGASRFGAQVMLDLLAGTDTERTGLAMVTTKPVPFPPEPLRSAVVQLTRSSLARADRNDGRRDVWLRVLDRLGLGFDS